MLERRRRAALRSRRAGLVGQRRHLPAERGDHRRRRLADRLLQLQADRRDAVALDDERPARGLRDLRLQPGEVGAAGGAGRLRRIAPAERGLEEPEVGHRVARDLLSHLRGDRDDTDRVLDVERHAAAEGAAGERGHRPGRAAGGDDERREGRRARGGEDAERRAPVAEGGRPPAAAELPPRQCLLREEDDRPRGADDRQRPEQRHLGPELRLHRRDEQRAEEADRDRVDLPAAPRLRRRLRIRDHEREEDEHLGRGDQHLPEVAVRNRAEVPVRRERVAAQSQDAERARECEPEEDRDLEHAHLRQHDEGARDDHEQDDHERRGQRAPPERERLRPAAAEDHERENESDVRRVEDMPAPELDEVLRGHRNCRDRRVDPDTVEAPPLAVPRAGDAHDERDPVAREHRARRPDDGALLPERHHELDQRAGEDRARDLRERESEMELDEAQHVQEDERRRKPKPRVLPRRQHHRIRGAADPQRSLSPPAGRARLRSLAQRTIPGHRWPIEESIPSLGLERARLVWQTSCTPCSELVSPITRVPEPTRDPGLTLVATGES